MMKRYTGWLILFVVCTCATLFAGCGNNASEDKWVCCFNDEDYYACPNKSAQQNCENADQFPPGVCDRKPTKDQECQ